MNNVVNFTLKISGDYQDKYYLYTKKMSWILTIFFFYIAYKYGYYISYIKGENPTDINIGMIGINLLITVLIMSLLFVVGIVVATIFNKDDVVLNALENIFNLLFSPLLFTKFVSIFKSKKEYSDTTLIIQYDILNRHNKFIDILENDIFYDLIKKYLIGEKKYYSIYLCDKYTEEMNTEIRYAVQDILNTDFNKFIPFYIKNEVKLESIFLVYNNILSNNDSDIENDILSKEDFIFLLENVYKEFIKVIQNIMSKQLNEETHKKELQKLDYQNKKEDIKVMIQKLKELEI